MMDRQVSVGIVQLFTVLRNHRTEGWGVYGKQNGDRHQLWFSMAFLIYGGPGAAWLGSFDGELVNFLLMNSEDLYYEHSLTWESKQSKDFFAPFVVSSYTEPSSWRNFKRRFPAVLREAGQCCLTPVQRGCFCISCVLQAPLPFLYTSFHFAKSWICSLSTGSLDKSLCIISS